MDADDLSREQARTLFDQYSPGYNRPMSPVERRVRLIALLARIDQETAEAASQMTDPELGASERDRAAAQWEFFQKSLVRVEAMLGDNRLGSSG